MFLSASTCRTSLCILLLRASSSDFNAAILSIHSLGLWIRWRQRSRNGTIRNFWVSTFNLTIRQASNCEGCPAFAAWLTNSNGDQGLPQVWTICSWFASLSRRSLPNKIGGKDWSSPPSSLNVFAGWIERSFAPFGNTRSCGASSLRFCLHFWWSWKFGSSPLIACNLIRALNVGTKGGSRLAFRLKTCSSFHLL